jgi:hypothetical protein
VDRCDECGFAYDLDEAAAAGPTIVAGATELAAILSDGGADVHARRDPARWSTLEYACHVRDVLMVQRERVLAARRTDCPSFDPMGRDERVEHDGYAEQDPLDVARRLGPTEWDRTVMYNYPKTLERSLRWVAVHTVHELRHHLLDVRRQAGTIE